MKTLLKLLSCQLSRTMIAPLRDISTRTDFKPLSKEMKVIEFRDIQQQSCHSRETPDLHVLLDNRPEGSLYLEMVC